MTTIPVAYRYGSALPRIDTCDHSDVPSVKRMTKCVTTHRHFIPPVPPTYVTEYEANFRWPPSYAYDQFRNYIGRPTFTSGNIASDGTLTPIYTKLSPRGNNWKQLNDVVTKLCELGYERNMLAKVKEAIEARRFDSILEYAYSHFQDALRSNEPQLQVEPSWDGQRASGKESVATSADIPNMSPEVASLCKKFVEVMDAIKAV